MPTSDLFRVTPGSSVKLAAIPADGTPGLPDDGDQARTLAEAELIKHRERIIDIQYDLWAEDRRALLIVLQGMDTSGKDGAVRHVFSGVNPQGCRVWSFKKPSEEEADRDFLWRIHQRVPPKGEIGIFNRSHYEDVLVVRVHNLVPEATWRQRYDMINSFESLLMDGHTTILKFFLHISKKEQKERLQARLDNPRKNWKFETGDLEERKHWDEYQRAYEAALEKCSTAAAPWHIIPADRKWYRNWAIAAVVRETLEAMNPKPPSPRGDLSKVRIED